MAESNTFKQVNMVATSASTRPSVITSKSPLIFGGGVGNNVANSNFVQPSTVYGDSNGSMFAQTDMGNVRFIPAPYGQKVVVGFTQSPSEHYAKSIEHLKQLYMDRPEFTYMKYANERNMANRRAFVSRNLGTIVGKPAVPERADLRVKVKDSKIMFDPTFARVR